MTLEHEFKKLGDKYLKLVGYKLLLDLLPIVHNACLSEFPEHGIKVNNSEETYDYNQIWDYTEMGLKSYAGRIRDLIKDLEDQLPKKEDV